MVGTDKKAQMFERVGKALVDRRGRGTGNGGRGVAESVVSRAVYGLSITEQEGGGQDSAPYCVCRAFKTGG